ncbi:glycosyltransferase family 9 protein [Entomohabitans teleogrylli]|uniref:glycosyltransferase family 9 protein n=1 Tax=Entomohabitans teleogrylli TaxID=1384589 RepID=UPI00137B8F51|nr:glycosyltransferase family 9 protein [Entomohabitans teleogrylli]
MSPWKPDSVKKILVLRDDNKIGDMIVSTGLFSKLAAAGKHIDVVAGKDNAFIISNLSQIKNIFVYHPRFSDIFKLGLRLRKEKYDLVLDFGDYISPVYYFFICLINARHTLGFNKNNLPRYDINIDYPFVDQHVTKRYKQVITLLTGEQDENYHYLLSIPEQERAATHAFLSQLAGNKMVVINPFAARKERNLSPVQVDGMVRFIRSIGPHIDIVLIGPAQLLATFTVAEGVVKNPGTTFFSAMACIEKASLVISPDTSWVHVACAFDKPLIALYGSNVILGGFINNKVWAPNYPLARQIITTEDMLSSIPVDDINKEIAAMSTFLSSN